MGDPGGFLDNSAGFDAPPAGGNVFIHVSSMLKQVHISDSSPGFGSSGLGGEGGIVNSWRIKHPVVTFFHLLFRTLAIIGKSIIGCQG